MLHDSFSSSVIVTSELQKKKKKKVKKPKKKPHPTQKYIVEEHPHQPKLKHVLVQLT